MTPGGRHLTFKSLIFWKNFLKLFATQIILKSFFLILLCLTCGALLAVITAGRCLTGRLEPSGLAHAYACAVTDGARAVRYRRTRTRAPAPPAAPRRHQGRGRALARARHNLKWSASPPHPISARQRAILCAEHIRACCKHASSHYRSAKRNTTP